MSFTQNQLDAINAAISSGSLVVEFNGKRVQYRSIDDLIKARNLIRNEMIAEGIIADNRNSNRGPASLAVFGRE